jgi:hypothetical protein
LESDYAKEALNRWYHLLYAGKLASVTLADFVRMTGLKLMDKEKRRTAREAATDPALAQPAAGAAHRR